MWIFALGFAAVFFAFSVQLMLVTFGIFFRGLGGFLFIILGSALAVETLKSLGLYSLIRKGRVARDLSSVVKLTFFSASGFYLGEKIFLLLLTASFLPLLGAYPGISIAGVLFFPLLLHMTTSGLISTGLLYGGQRGYPWVVLLASILHIAFVVYIIDFMNSFLGF